MRETDDARARRMRGRTVSKGTSVSLAAFLALALPAAAAPRRVVRDFPERYCPVHSGVAVSADGTALTAGAPRVVSELTFNAASDRSRIVLSTCFDGSVLQPDAEIGLDDLAVVLAAHHTSQQLDRRDDTVPDHLESPDPFDELDCYQEESQEGFSNTVGTLFDPALKSACGSANPDCPFADAFESGPGDWSFTGAVGLQVFTDITPNTNEIRFDPSPSCATAQVEIAGLQVGQSYVLDWNWRATIYDRTLDLLSVDVVPVFPTPPAPGQPSPVGGEFQVNSYTTGAQGYPSVALDADGSFFVVWASAGSSGSDSSGQSVQGQRYSADGTPLGSEFQINTLTTDDQKAPVIELDADGDAVVVWESGFSSGTDTSGASIQGRLYGADGTPLGSEFQVNTYTTGAQALPTVAMTANGSFVVVWFDASSSPDVTVQGQRFASDGSPLGSEFQVSGVPGNKSDASVAMSEDGGFVVVWSVWSYADGSDWGVHGRRFASDGSPLGSEFLVNTYTTNSQLNPSVAMDAAGDFVVVWGSGGSSGTDSSAYSVQGQRFASDGSPRGNEFQVNTFTTDSQSGPSVSMEAGGEFVVAWTSQGSGGTDSSSASVQGQRFDSDGAPLGNEFQVNTFTTSQQNRPELSTSADGRYVVVWMSNGSSGTDSSGYSVQGQRLVIPRFGLFLADDLDPGTPLGYRAAP